MPNVFSDFFLQKTLTGFGLCCSLFLIPTPVHAATTNAATIQWAANQEPDLAGYRAYHGTTSGNYGSPHNIGNATTYQFTNLADNTTHYFSITAHDLSGNESPPSLEVSKTFTMVSANPPVITAPSSYGAKLAKAAKKERKKLAKAAKKEQKKSKQKKKKKARR